MAAIRQSRKNLTFGKIPPSLVGKPYLIETASSYAGAKQVSCTVPSRADLLRLVSLVSEEPVLPEELSRRVDLLVTTCYQSYGYIY